MNHMRKAVGPIATIEQINFVSFETTEPSADICTMDLLPGNCPSIVLAHAERHKSP